MHTVAEGDAYVLHTAAMETCAPSPPAAQRKAADRWDLAAGGVLRRGTFVSKTLSFIVELAVNQASDLVQERVNTTVHQVMERVAGGEYYTFQTDASGRITALSVNVDQISQITTEILDVTMKTDDGQPLELDIPLETLLGINLIPEFEMPLPVRILMLTTPQVDYHNELASAAINQSKYQLYLHVGVEIDVLIPWQKSTVEVETDVLLAETVIVGDVPGTYIEVEQS